MNRVYCKVMEQTWLDEDTALKAAASKGVGGSSPSCSATFERMKQLSFSEPMVSECR